MKKSKLLLTAICIAPLAACSITTAEINSGSVVGNADRCDNSVTVNEGTFNATSVCYKDGKVVSNEVTDGD